MTDKELVEAVAALDDAETDALTTFEADFVASMLRMTAHRGWPDMFHSLSDKQRAVAEELVEKYGGVKTQNIQMKFPPGAEKYFRK